uniref:Uncharacterized protein n=1 Tax=viral metagenome TaxID=1070528 RepID=A0A6C0HL86_9ZZZZ
MNYKLDSPYDAQHTNFVKVDPILDVKSAILRNMRQMQYPNTRLNEPISNFQAFLPNTVTTARDNQFYMANYGNHEEKVLNYKPPSYDRIKICGRQPVSSMSHTQMKMYTNTKHSNKFPVPLPTNGINELNTLRDDRSTSFTYTHYTPVVNKSYVDSPIYYSDLSQDNIDMHDEYTAKIAQTNLHIFNGVIDDMNILCKEIVSEDGGDSVDYVNYDKSIKYVIDTFI